MVSTFKLRHTFDLNFVWVTSRGNLKLFLQNTHPSFLLYCVATVTAFKKVVIILLRNCQAFQQTLLDSNRVYMNRMVSIKRLHSNQTVLAMVYPRVALTGNKKLKNSPKFVLGVSLL